MLCSLGAHSSTCLDIHVGEHMPGLWQTVDYVNVLNFKYCIDGSLEKSLSGSRCGEHLGISAVIVDRRYVLDNIHLISTCMYFVCL